MVKQGKNTIKEVVGEVKTDEVKIDEVKIDEVVDEQPTSSEVDVEQPASSNEPIAPSKPTKKIAENHIQVAMDKDAMPSTAFIKDVEKLPKDRQAKMMEEMMTEMKDLAVKYTYVKKLLKGEKGKKGETEIFKRVEVHKEGIAEPFVLEVGSRMTGAGFRDECARHFKIPKKSWNNFTLLTDVQRTDCLESSRATVGGDKSKEKGITPEDHMVYHFVEYQ